MSRPAFVDELLRRPLPPLHPQHLTETKNKPFSPSLASSITDGLFHPLLEATSHLMNNDLFSAHFLVRKMQEDPIGKWLHGILHKLEGDYANAKCWYRDMPADVLASYFDASDAQRDAWLYLDRIAILSGKTQDWCRKTSETAEIQDRAADPPTLESLNEDEVRKQAWGELVCVLEMLEREHGWARDVDGSKAYTSDGKEIGDAKLCIHREALVLAELTFKLPLPTKVQVWCIMPFRAVIFDIGGVVVGSPLTGIGKQEREHGLPHHYLNALITAHGNAGAFQRFERGELDYDEFLATFTSEMNDVITGNKAYEIYCKRRGIDQPKLPTSLKIDGEELWGKMMAETLTPDPVVVNAIDRIRASGKFKIAALTNNFTPASGSEKDDSAVRDLFDHYIESSVVGKRKPDPAFYEHALQLLGIEAKDAVFLDDIGHNLKAAQDLGISTIRVLPGRSDEAIAELEKRIGLELLEKKR